MIFFFPYPLKQITLKLKLNTPKTIFFSIKPIAILSALLFFGFSLCSAQDHTTSLRDSSELEQVFVKLGLQNVQSSVPSIKVDLRYATENNFMKMNMYGSIDQAYLQADVVKKLILAQKLLKDSLPDYSLVVLDATRPVSVQQLMWDKIDVPANKKSKYLSNPKYGSLHNFGAAVDLSIMDEKGKLLDMATPFDSFEKLAYPFYEDQYLASGKLSQKQYNNRKLLHNLMIKAGFMGITTEWWHYNSCYRKEAKKKYTLVHSHRLSDYETPKEQMAQIETTDSLVFRVQILTSGKAKGLSWVKLKHKADYAYFHKGLYKYTGGQFSSMKAAHVYKNKLRKMGFKGSFVVPFYQGKRISIKDANELMQ